MNINQTTIGKAKINAILKDMSFDPRETNSRENVAIRSGVDYCINRAIEELVVCVNKKEASINAVKLLVCAIALFEDYENDSANKAN